RRAGGRGGGRVGGGRRARRGGPPPPPPPGGGGAPGEGGGGGGPRRQRRVRRSQQAPSAPHPHPLRCGEREPAVLRVRPRLTATAASSRRRWRGGSPGRRASTSPASPAPGRTGG